MTTVTIRRQPRRTYSLEATAKRNEQARKLNREARTRVQMFLGGKCDECGINDSRVLQIDHKNGAGEVHRNGLSSRTAHELGKAVFADPNSFQLLCANCNWIKAFERGEHAGYLKARQGNN